MTKVVIQNFKIGQGLLHCWRWNHCTNRLSQPMSRLIWVEGKRIICSVRASHLEGLPFRERVESVRTFNVFFNGKHLTWLYLSQMRKPWRTRFLGYFLGTITKATCILGPSSVYINKMPISVKRFLTESRLSHVFDLNSKIFVSLVFWSIGFQLNILKYSFICDYIKKCLFRF